MPDLEAVITDGVDLTATHRVTLTNGDIAYILKALNALECVMVDSGNGVPDYQHTEIKERLIRNFR